MFTGSANVTINLHLTGETRRFSQKSVDVTPGKMKVNMCFNIGILLPSQLEGTLPMFIGILYNSSFFHILLNLSDLCILWHSILPVATHREVLPCLTCKLLINVIT